MLYDKACPYCGTINKNLWLDETGGTMECEHCLRITQFPGFQEKVSDSEIKTVYGQSLISKAVLAS